MKSYRDIVGDGGSRIVEQIDAIHAGIEQSLSGVRRRVAIGSGKGGVGKSTLTLQLASALQAGGARCAILDADMNGPSQARLTGVVDRPLVPGDRGIALPRTADGIGVISLGTVVPETDAVDFDSVSSGASHTWRATREFSALGELLAAVEWGELDYLLIDLPPGAERTVQYAEFFGPETAFVLVTLPSALSHGVVARSVAALQGAPNRLLGYIENMAGYHCSDCGEVKPLFPVTQRVDLGIPRLGRIPFDPELAARCDRGEAAPTGEADPVSRATREAADNIVRVLEKKR